MRVSRLSDWTLSKEGWSKWLADWQEIYLRFQSSTIQVVLYSFFFNKKHEKNKKSDC